MTGEYWAKLDPRQIVTLWDEQALEDGTIWDSDLGRTFWDLKPVDFDNWEKQL